MKRRLLILLLAFNFNLFSQNHEIELNYRIGYATNQNKMIELDLLNHLSYKQAETRYDHGLYLMYAYKIWKKANLFLSGGVELSNSKHYFRLVDGGGGYQLANIELSMSRFAYRIGLKKQFNFYQNKLILELGCHIVDRYYFSDSKIYSQELTTSQLDWKKYSYELETKHDQYYLNPSGIENKRYMYLNLDYSLGLKFNVTSDLFVNFGLSYSRNNIFFYDYEYRVESYLGGSSTPTYIYTNEGIEDGFKYGVRDHFVYLNIGLTYKFNWKSK